MSTRTAPIRLATAGAEMCRLTVQTPSRRCDVALPVAASIGEVLPLVIDETRDGVQSGGPWVLQLLGGPALDPGSTPESLGLFDGATLYVSPAVMPMPEAEFDDVSVGLADIVAARGDQWKPEFSRYLLLVAGLVATGALVAVSATARSHPLEVVWCALATVGLTVWAVLGRRVFDDTVTSLACGFAACAVGGLTGLALAHPKAPLLTLDHKSVALLGVCVFVPAAVCAVLGRLPMTLFGGLAAWSVAAALGAVLSSSFSWIAAQSAAVIAVFLLAFGTRGVRSALRFARLRPPLLPRTALELQQDIDPDPEAVVVARSGRVVDYLNILFLTTALMVDVACVLLSREVGWVYWTLALVMSVAALLRSAAVTSAWQRAPLALAGFVGIAAVVIARTSASGNATKSLVLLVILLGCAGLYAASRLMPGRRMLPVWGHIADLLEMWTAVALVPLLLELFHVYAHIRDLIH
jgi:type VII secretion integral membrane protein EccD